MVYNRGILATGRLARAVGLGFGLSFTGAPCFFDQEVRMRTFRQGDVLLEKMESLPPGAALQGNRDNRIVLAYGEATGHAHAVSTEFANLYRIGRERYLLTTEGARLVHEEHAPIALEPGVYRVVQQREYIPKDPRRRSTVFVENRPAPRSSRNVKD